MLNQYPKLNEHILPKSLKQLRNTFDRQRKRTAQKLNNPRLMKISFHTFRHWKATMEYHKTKDILHVKAILGHKTIECTLIYINIENALFQVENDEYQSAVAHDLNEIQKLIETGFEYVTDMEGYKIFRKRK
jgi:integrase